MSSSQDRNVSRAVLVFVICLPGLLVSRPLSQAAPTGSIRGKVVDVEVRSGVPQAVVRLRGLSAECLTGTEGEFAFADVPVGAYVLEVACPHYLVLALPDIVVKSGRTTVVEAKLQLESAPDERREVTVTAGFFAPTQSQPSSTASFSYEEIRRAAGAAGDISRVIGGLPGVAQTNDQVNSLVVRGGSPAENGFYLDNIEVPNINHYPVLGSTAGAIGLLNVDFIRDVEFSSGAFPPLFGDRLSSVMEISFREGDQEDFGLQLELSMMGVGLLAEGPLPGGKGSWMLSARRSYIDLLIGLMGQGVPVHWSDLQGKMAFDLSSKHKLTLLGLAGFDDSGTKQADAVKDGESFYGGLDTLEYVAGLNWLAMWGNWGYSNTSLSFSSTGYKDDAYHTVSGELARKGDSSDRMVSLRNVNTFRLAGSLKLQFGLEVRHVAGDYDYILGGGVNVLGHPVAAVSRQKSLTADREGVFARFTWSPLSALTLDVGGRVDHYGFTRRTYLSPRFSLAVRVWPGTIFQASIGRHYQPLPLLFAVSDPDARRLDDPRALHLVLGIRQRLAESIQLTVEAYLKEYSRFPADPGQPLLFIFDEILYAGGTAEHSALVSTGRARCWGVEVLLQKKLARNVYGLVSGSFFRTRYLDGTGAWRDRIYDHRIIFSAEGGWRVSPTWEFGLKCGYAGGAAYTPFDLEASRAANSGIFDQKKINGSRLPAYFSLNLRCDKRFNFRSSNLILSLSIWNVSDRQNVMAYYWNAITLEPGMTLGWGILPVLGVEFEF